MSFVRVLLALVVVGIRSTNGDATFERLLRPYWYFEGKNITFSCIAKNIDDHTIIKWYVEKTKLISNSPSSGIVITNSRNGSTLIGMVTLTNSTNYRTGRHFMVCKLFNGTTDKPIQVKSFDFRYLFDKNRPNVTVSAERTKVGYGDSITLRCSASGNIIIEKINVTWSKGGRLLNWKSMDGKAVDLHHVVSKADSSSGGDYMCKAFARGRGVDFQDNDTLSLSVIPKLIGAPEKTFYYNVNQSVLLSCDIDGYPLSIYWQKKSPDGSFQNISGGGHYIIKEGGRNLRIVSFQSDDATDYICKDKHIVQKTTLIEIVSVPHRFGDKNVTFVPGRSITLNCNIYVVPSCISWTMYDPRDGKTHDLTGIPGVYPPTKCNNTLWFTNVSEIANGQVFSCNNGSFAQHFTVVKMTVPRLTGPKTKEVKVETGDDVTLKCDIDVNPLIITWEVDGRVINASTDTKYKISKDHPLILRINDVQHDDRRSFYCSAKNDLSDGQVRQEIILRVKDPRGILWPIIGTVIVIVLVALSIGLAALCRRRRRRNTPKVDQPDGTLLQEDLSNVH